MISGFSTASSTVCSCAQEGFCSSPGGTSLCAHCHFVPGWHHWQSLVPLLGTHTNTDTDELSSQVSLLKAEQEPVCCWSTGDGLRPTRGHRKKCVCSFCNFRKEFECVTPELVLKTSRRQIKGALNDPGFRCISSRMVGKSYLPLACVHLPLILLFLTFLHLFIKYL